MKYMMLIHQGTTPVPGTDAWENLPDDEKGAVYAAYKALNETQGVTPGQGLQPPETATTVRVQDGRTLTTDGPFAEIKEAIGGYFLLEADGLALEDYRYLDATRGELLRRLGRTGEAREAYGRALALAHDAAERRLLQRRLAELEA